MIKTILVPASGSDTDHVVFDTALAVARLFRAHLDFFHLRIGLSGALPHTPHVDFARGPALRNALQELKDELKRRSEAAERHVHEFCERNKIAVVDAPPARHMISASWHQEDGEGEEPFIAWARVHDLTVMGRFTRPNGLPADLLQLLLVECGRPIVIAASHAPRTLPGTVMVCWKDAREPARVVAAAMPFLTEAERVVIATIAEGGPSANDAQAVARQLAWHGIQAEAQSIKADGRPVATLLSSAAQECGADLLVMGSYSTGPLRQRIFGGCTHSMLGHGDVPVFMLH